MRSYKIILRDPSEEHIIINLSEDAFGILAVLSDGQTHKIPWWRIIEIIHQNK